MMSPKRHRLTNIQRWEMRRELVSSISEGYSLSSVIDAIVKKFEVKPKTVYKDWQRRNRWIGTLVKLDNAQLKTAEIVLHMRRIAEAAWETYRSARKVKNHKAMLGAIDKLIRISVRETEISQSLGILAKQPEKLDAMITTSGPMPWEQIPEVQKALERMREKLRAEKAAEKDTAAASELLT